MGALVDVLTWLDVNSKPLGAISSIVFGISSATVALATLVMSYRHNFGRKPLLLVAQQVLSTGDNDSVCLTVTFEVWNRQKYPVGLKFLFVTFRNERADFDADHAGWMM
jgi:hypothetical protein